MTNMLSMEDSIRIIERVRRRLAQLAMKHPEAEPDLMTLLGETITGEWAE